MEQINDNEELKKDGLINKSSENKEIISKINEIRNDPIKYANKLALTMSYINKRDFTLKEPNKPIITFKEGIKGFDEAVSILKQTNELQEFNIVDSLSKIALDHANYLLNKSGLGNDLNDNKRKFEERFKRYGTYNQIEEIILPTDTFDINRILINLIVCDGEEKRTFRNLILSNTLNQIGAGFSELNKKGFLVIYLASGFKKRNVKSNTSVKSEVSQSSKLSKINDIRT